MTAPFVTALLLSCLLHVIASLPSPSSPSPDFSKPCTARECGAMPMLMLQCSDGTAAGYTCQRNATTGICRLVSPHCPPQPTGGSSDDTNGTSTNSSHGHTIHYGPSRIAPIPYYHSTSASSHTSALYTSSQPVFNCSRRQCGASIMPLLLTCPDGSHAYPLCAWVSERHHCGYLDPSCSYPGWRSDAMASINSAADVELLDADGKLMGGGHGTARQICERGACTLPMYIKLCLGGTSVRPHCVWSNVNGTELCLANEPSCPTAEGAEQDDLVVKHATNETNGAVLRGMSFALLSITAILGLLAV